MFIGRHCNVHPTLERSFDKDHGACDGSRTGVPYPTLVEMRLLKVVEQVLDPGRENSVLQSDDGSSDLARQTENMHAVEMENNGKGSITYY